MNHYDVFHEDIATFRKVSYVNGRGNRVLQLPSGVVVTLFQHDDGYGFCVNIPDHAPYFGSRGFQRFEDEEEAIAELIDVLDEEEIAWRPDYQGAG